MDENKEQISLKPSTGTYLRLAGVAISDIVAVYGLYEAFDPALATVLAAIVAFATILAAWKNNSLTKGAVAADHMKDVFSDAVEAETIKGRWAEIQAAVKQVYDAIKAGKEGN